MSIAKSIDNPEEHLVFKLKVVNVGRRVIQIVQAGIILPNILSEAEKATGAELIESLIRFIDESNEERLILTENTTHTFDFDPCDWGTAFSLSPKSEAFVDDSTGKRHTTTFWVGDMPDEIRKIQEHRHG